MKINSRFQHRNNLQRILCHLTGLVLSSGLVASLDAQAAIVQLNPVLPNFNTASFGSNSSISDNSFFPLEPGKRFIYEGENVDQELERSEVFVTFETKNILGVTSRVVRDRAYVDNVLVEDTFDWLAQDTDGNVWYMGEFVTNFEYDDKGTLIGTDNAGSWEAGVNGALPGYIMEANPKVDDNYYQESAPNNGALDQAKVFSQGESISIDYGKFNNVLKTLETTELEPDVLEFKNYAPGTGLILVEEDLDENLEPGFIAELVSVETVPEPTAVLGLLGAGLFGFRMQHGMRRSKS